MPFCSRVAVSAATASLRGRLRPVWPPSSRSRCPSGSCLCSPVACRGAASNGGAGCRHTPLPEGSGDSQGSADVPGGGSGSVGGSSTSSTSSSSGVGQGWWHGSAFHEAWLSCSPLERRQILTVSLSAAVLNLGFGVVIPALPALSQQLGFGATGVGLLLAAPSVAKLLANLPAGAMGDSFGRVRCMVAGTCISALGILGTGTVGTLAVMLPIRFVQGFGSSLASASACAYLVDLTERHHLRPYRGLIVGSQGGLIAVGYVLGPAIGGLLTDAFGAQTAYCVVAALTAGCAALYATLPEVPAAACAAAASAAPAAATAATAAAATASAPSVGGSGGSAWAGDSRKLLSEAAGTWRVLLRDPNQQGLLLGNSVLFLNYAAMVTALPLQAFHTFGATPGDIGMLFSLASILGVVLSPVAGGWADRYGRLTLIVPSTVMMTAGCAGVAFAGDWSHFVAAYVLWSVGEAVLSPAVSAYAADVAPKANTGSAMALSKQAQDFVFFAAPLGLGVLYDACPGPAAMATTAVLTAFGGAAFRARSREVFVQPLAGPRSGPAAATKL
mmetsp:Transcript_52797/g.171789  ORF Transcript_52797/g.171789 Transcript_52797/m.171789 type:complete len:558 (-) Transcript_52797:78-1751(-)